MLFRTIAAALCAVVLPVLATPQNRDVTDMWFDPAESGWGVNFIHQGNTLFGTLFVFGADRQPKWFVAPNVSGDGGVYTGHLHDCTGPWLGAAFDPASVSCRDVGTLRFEPGESQGNFEYTIDNVHLTKQVRRFSFRRVPLQGVYEGYLVQPAMSGSLERRRDDLTLVVTEDGNGTFSMDSSSDSEGACRWLGTETQAGQLVHVEGTFQCPGRSGPWSMTVDPTTEGFTGRFDGDGFFTGRIAAARRTGDVRMQGTGWRNDMWFIPAENGWGLNVIGQGETLFATLFVFDSARRPRWYVASNLTQEGDSADGRVTYSGALHEATGPYFGGPFAPSAVTPRQVGQMSFQARPDGTGVLTYTVDGIQVAKQVQRFAFRKQDLSGSYLGSYAHDRQASITIDDSGSDFRMQLVDRFGGLGTCNFVAPFVQVGSLRTMSGTYTCGTRNGTFTMQHATVSASGFTARFDTPMFDFRAIANGHIGGVRR